MDRVSSIFARFEPGRRLTSDVIGHVLPRTASGGGAVFTEAHPRLPSIPSTSFISPEARPPQTPLDCLVEASLAQRMSDVTVRTTKAIDPLAATTTHSPVHQATPSSPLAPSAPTQPLPQPTATSRTVPSDKTIQSDESSVVKRKRIRKKSARRREQCRMNQARYRKKQSEYLSSLETSVAQLQHEIPILELQHNRLVSNGAWNVVVEYFHLFRNGSRLCDQVPSGPERWLQKSEAQQQLVFLHTSLSEDILLGERQGVDALVEQWKRYTSSFDDLQFQLDHMTKVSDELITATAFLDVTVSETTLHNVFPHLLTGHEKRWNTKQKDKATILRSKLLGQRLHLPCRLDFEWDERSNRVVRMESSVDFASSLFQVLRSIGDVALVLQHALVTQDGVVGGAAACRS